jgi:hypothetical protein
MIRQQQAQLQQLQSQNAAAHGTSDSGTAAATSGTAVADDPQPTPPRAGTPSAAGSTSYVLPPQPIRALSPGPRIASHHSSPHSLRSRSRRSSRSSPIYAAAPTTPGGILGAAESLGSSSGARDEAAFYAAETQSIVRENQMLRARIRELERRVHDMEGPSTDGGTASASVAESKEEESRTGAAGIGG